MDMCYIINDINKLGVILGLCDATIGTFWRKGASPMKNGKKHIF